MKGTYLSCSVLAICLGCSVPGLLAQNMSHEEEVVRNAYAKVELLCSLKPITQAGISQMSGSEVDQQLIGDKVKEATPSFELTDFNAGKVADIADEPWRQFVTPPPPGEKVLWGGLVTLPFSDNGNLTQWQAAEVRWNPGPTYYDPDEVRRLFDRSVRETIKEGTPYWSNTPVTYTRYASFTVNATFQGHSSGPHKAIFFFGTDSHGMESIALNDLISGVQPLWDGIQSTQYPTGLLRSSLRDTPTVASWTRANDMPTASCAPTKGDDICCSHGRCGISVANMNRDLSTPLPQPKKSGGQ
jgi:hypothetical protein